MSWMISESLVWEPFPAAAYHIVSGRWLQRRWWGDDETDERNASYLRVRVMTWLLRFCIVLCCPDRFGGEGSLRRIGTAMKHENKNVHLACFHHRSNGTVFRLQKERKNGARKEAGRKKIIKEVSGSRMEMRIKSFRPFFSPSPSYFHFRIRHRHRPITYIEHHQKRANKPFGFGEEEMMNIFWGKRLSSSQGMGWSKELFDHQHHDQGVSFPFSMRMISLGDDHHLQKKNKTLENKFSNSLKPESSFFRTNWAFFGLFYGGVCNPLFAISDFSPEKTESI